MADEVAFPNGMAISPDGTTLLVAESFAPAGSPRSMSTTTGA